MLKDGVRDDAALLGRGGACEVSIRLLLGLKKARLLLRVMLGDVSLDGGS